MVTCEVKDETGTCNLVIFDREFSRIVGTSAAEIKEQIAHKQVNQLFLKCSLNKKNIFHTTLHFTQIDLHINCHLFGLSFKIYYLMR